MSSKWLVHTAFESFKTVGHGLPYHARCKVGYCEASRVGDESQAREPLVQDGNAGRTPAHGGQEPAPGYVELVLQWLRRQAQHSPGS